MKYLIIEDNETFAKQLCSQLNGNEEAPENDTIKPSSESLNVLSDSIKARINGNIDVVLCINVNLIIGKDRRQLQKGIELLIWLRIKGVLNHCLLYSFEDLYTILNREPKHLIATSQGTTFVQYPYNFTKLVYEILKNSAAHKVNLERHLRVAFENIGLKHKLANIYGLWFMFNINNTYFEDERLEYDIFGKEFIQEFNILQLLIANYLVCESNKPPTNNLLNNIVELKNLLRMKDPKILYIDDKAELGWAEFLKKIIYGNNISDNFQYLVPEKRIFDNQTEFDDFFKTVHAMILNKKDYIDCLLLDLRLADESGDNDDLDNLSGIRLLKRIHQCFPALPVIMFTASNRAKSVKKIIECGADGLWTKPGLDDLKDNNYYLESYRELLSFLVAALSKYVSDTEKEIVNAQFATEIIIESGDYPEELTDIDIILTDTTFWCAADSELVNNHKSARRLLNLSRNVQRKKFVVINDVINELFIHTQKKDNIALQLSSLFGLKSIQKYKETTTYGHKWIESGYRDVENAIKENSTYVKEAVSGGGFHIVSNVKKIHSFHQDESEAVNELVSRRNSGFRTLHADDTFQMLIPYYMRLNKNVLFITDDFNSNVPNIVKTIGLKFNNENWTVPDGFKKKESILKVSVGKVHCLILHSKVLHKLCISD